MAANAPILSTPAEHILEEPFPVAVRPSEVRLSEEELHLQYEIRRTVHEIRSAKSKRIALQFPDELLVDAPRVYERLRDELRHARDADRRDRRDRSVSKDGPSTNAASTGLPSASLDPQEIDAENVEERICILADTSYGACCVDEVAAEHVEADIVVHYGRTCLSPTARLPVIYIYTSKSLDINAVYECFKSTYPDKNERVCLVADTPFAHLLPAVKTKLDEEGYAQVFKTEIVQDPSSLIPNRSIPLEVVDDPERLREYSVFHISSPPTSLLLILASRIKSMHIFPTDGPDHESNLAAPEVSTRQLLRRRYALVTQLSTVSIFGILINTLSVSNYMEALVHCQRLIAQSGKKSYVFVVGKVNSAKVANFSEIGGWVVIGCWESSLIESKDFYRPLITPFELEIALTDDKHRVWNGEWIGNFASLLEKEALSERFDEERFQTNGPGESGDEELSDDEPPEFDLRTGKYISHTRPMRSPHMTTRASEVSIDEAIGHSGSSALVQRAKGDIAAVGGHASPAAEFLRAKRTWQGLGSDFEIAYAQDDRGRMEGAEMEEGRSGIARGYTADREDVKR